MSTAIRTAIVRESHGLISEPTYLLSNGSPLAKRYSEADATWRARLIADMAKPTPQRWEWRRLIRAILASDSFLLLCYSKAEAAVLSSLIEAVLKRDGLAEALAAYEPGEPQPDEAIPTASDSTTDEDIPI